MSDKAKAVATLAVNAVVVVNMVLQVFGVAPFAYDAGLVYKVVSIIALLVMGGYSWWKNQNITSFASLSQAVLDALKNGTIDADAIEALLAGTKAPAPVAPTTPAAPAAPAEPTTPAETPVAPTTDTKEA